MGPPLASKLVNYQAVLSAISRVLVENLNNTGIRSEDVEDVLYSVFHSLTSKIDKDEITIEGLVTTSELITSAAIGALDTAPG